MSMALELSALMTLLVSAGLSLAGLINTIDKTDFAGFDPRKVLALGIFGLIVVFPALAGFSKSVCG